MEQAQFEGSELALGEEANATAPTPPAGATTVTRLEANEAQRILPTRRKLSEEQEGEVTRLYADTTMAVSEIARKFGIGESSVYRVAQRHGAPLRGTRTPPGAPPAKTARLVFGALQGALLVKRTTGDASQLRDVIAVLKLQLGGEAKPARR